MASSQSQVILSRGQIGVSQGASGGLMCADVVRVLAVAVLAACGDKMRSRQWRVLVVIYPVEYTEDGCRRASRSTSKGLAC